MAESIVSKVQGWRGGGGKTRVQGANHPLVPPQIRLCSMVSSSNPKQSTSTLSASKIDYCQVHFSIVLEERTAAFKTFL